MPTQRGYHTFYCRRRGVANERITVKEMVDGKQKVIGFSELEEWSKSLNNLEYGVTMRNYRDYECR